MSACPLWSRTAKSVKKQVNYLARAQNSGWCAYYNGGGMGGARNCGSQHFNNVWPL
jgi:hypothetical protein